MAALNHPSVQVAGYLLWRGGLLLAGAGSLYSVSRWVLAFWFLPAMVASGISLVLAGLVLVVVSLVLERRADDRDRQQDLRADA